MQTIQILFILSFFSFAFIQAAAQHPPAIDPAARKAMANLSFLEGEWEGKGWVMAGPGNKQDMVLQESIRYAADGTAMMIESESSAEGRPSIAVMIHFNSQAGEYVFNMSMSNGMAGRNRGEFKDGMFIWYQAENIRFTMSPAGEDAWHEIGEVNRNGEWMPIYEVNMQRVK